MNATIAYYKKTVSCALVVGMLSFGVDAIALYDSQHGAAVVEALTTAISNIKRRNQQLDSEAERCGCNKPKPPRNEEDADMQRCAACGKPKPQDSEMNANDPDRCGCHKPKPKGEGIADDASRAPRDSLVDPCNPCSRPCNISSCAPSCPDNSAALNAILALLQEQGREARKCCKRINHELDDIEDLVVSQIDAAASCCSVVEGLMISQIDQTALCCSVTETVLGDPTNPAIVPTCGELLTIVDFVNNLDVDAITLLKSIYILVARTYLCACEPCDF